MTGKPEELDRNFVRALLRHTQMDFPTEDQITLLHGCIARRLIDFDGIRGTYRVDHIAGKTIRVKSHYFENREGVTFDGAGWVGLAGWADETNIQPILWAVLDWVKEVTGYDATYKTLKDFEKAGA